MSRALSLSHLSYLAAECQGRTHRLIRRSGPDQCPPGKNDPPFVHSHPPVGEERPTPAGGIHPLDRLADCPEKFGDEIEGVMNWNAGSGVGELAGRSVRLRVVLKDADLYAFRFRKR